MPSTIEGSSGAREDGSIPRNRWNAVCETDTLASQPALAASVEGVDLLLVKSGLRVCAFEAHCPHRGALLSEANVHGGEIVCSSHGWRFDAVSGKRLGIEGA